MLNKFNLIIMIIYDLSKCSCTSFVKIEVEIRVSFMCSITTLSKQYLLGYLYIEFIDTVFDIINFFCPR